MKVPSEHYRALGGGRWTSSVVEEEAPTAGGGCGVFGSTETSS